MKCVCLCYRGRQWDEVCVCVTGEDSGMKCVCLCYRGRQWDEVCVFVLQGKTVG